MVRRDRPLRIAEKVSAGELDLMKLPAASAKQAEERLLPVVKDVLEKIRVQRKKREEYLCHYRRRKAALSLCYSGDRKYL